MTLKKTLAVAALVLAVFTLPYACKTSKQASKKPALDCSTVAASYSTDIAPIIANNCMPCHKAGSVKGDFSFYEGIKVAASNGELEQHALIKQDMPPKGPLPEADRKKIRCWLNNGAQNN